MAANTATVQAEARPVPEVLPVPADAEMQLKITRQMIGEPVKGTTAEVDPHLIEVREYAKYAIDYWQQQVIAAELAIIRQTGNAETMTVNGIPVLRRYVGEVKDYIVKGFTRDYFRTTKS